MIVLLLFGFVEAIHDLVDSFLDEHTAHLIAFMKSNLTSSHVAALSQIRPHRVYDGDVVDLAALNGVQLCELSALVNYIH